MGLVHGEESKLPEALAKPSAEETKRGLSGLVSRLEDAELASITGDLQPEHEIDLGSQIIHCEIWRLRSGGGGVGSSIHTVLTVQAFRTESNCQDPYFKQ